MRDEKVVLIMFSFDFYVFAALERTLQSHFIYRDEQQLYLKIWIICKEKDF